MTQLWVLILWFVSTPPFKIHIFFFCCITLPSTVNPTQRSPIIAPSSQEQGLREELLPEESREINGDGLDMLSRKACEKMGLLSYSCLPFPLLPSHLEDETATLRSRGGKRPSLGS